MVVHRETTEDLGTKIVHKKKLRRGGDFPPKQKETRTLKTTGLHIPRHKARSVTGTQSMAVSLIE